MDRTSPITRIISWIEQCKEKSTNILINKNTPHFNYSNHHNINKRVQAMLQPITKTMMREEGAAVMEMVMVWRRRRQRMEAPPPCGLLPRPSFKDEIGSWWLAMAAGLRLGGGLRVSLAARAFPSLNSLPEVGFAIRERSVANMPPRPSQKLFRLTRRSFWQLYGRSYTAGPNRSAI